MARSSETSLPTSADRTAARNVPALDARDVATRAYELYEARGGEPGADLDDWLQAERELRGVTDADGGQNMRRRSRTPR